MRRRKRPDGCLEVLANLESFCDEKFEDHAPSFGKLKTALSDVRHVIHGLLEKKREKEPDPVEEAPVAEPAAFDATNGDNETASVHATALTGSFTAEPADRQQAVAGIIAAAAFLRKREPFSPAPYLLLRGLRWGELRSSSRLADSSLLEAPPDRTSPANQATGAGEEMAGVAGGWRTGVGASRKPSVA